MYADDTTIYFNLEDFDPESQYLNILMTERGAPLSFCRILSPPQCPPPPDYKILDYLNDRDGGRYYFFRILAPPMPPPTCHLTPQYLTILMTERGAPLSFCRILSPPQCPPPPRLQNA